MYNPTVSTETSTVMHLLPLFLGGHSSFLFIPVVPSVIGAQCISEPVGRQTQWSLLLSFCRLHLLTGIIAHFEFIFLIGRLLCIKGNTFTEVLSFNFSLTAC